MEHFLPDIGRLASDLGAGAAIFGYWPSDSPLWGMPNVLITPHAAILGTPYRQKWEAILLVNCRRFGAGQPLLNVVEQKWY